MCGGHKEQRGGSPNCQPQPEKVGAGNFVCQQIFLEGVSRCPLAPHFCVGNKCENAMCRMLGQVAKGIGFTFPRGRSPTTALLASHTQS